MSAVQRDLPAGPLRGLMGVPAYPRLLAGSFLWHITRWAALFSVSYLLAQLAGSPIINQAVGALIYAPMLVGGLAAGAITNRFDHRLLVLRLQTLLVPVQIAMLLLVVTGQIQVWMTAPYTLVVGCGNLVNMTAQRAFIYDTVGPEHARPAMTLEAAAQAGATIVGTLGYGAVIDAFGIRAAFALSLVLLLASRIVLATVPAVHRERDTVGLPGLGEQLRLTRDLVRRHNGLRGLIAMTVLMNFFALGYQPLVPLISRSFSGSALLAGVMSGLPAAGQVLGGAALASRQFAGYARVLVLGSAGFLVFLTGFALAPTVGVAIVALLLAGIGLSGFAAMQAIMSTDGFTTSERGTALGVVSTTIGIVEPIGMLQIGVSAEIVGARTALAASALIGLVCVTGFAAGWTAFRRSPSAADPAWDVVQEIGAGERC